MHESRTKNKLKKKMEWKIGQHSYHSAIRIFGNLLSQPSDQLRYLKMHSLLAWLQFFYLLCSFYISISENECMYVYRFSVFGVRLLLFNCNWYVHEIRSCCLRKQSKFETWVKLAVFNMVSVLIIYSHFLLNFFL